MADGQEADEGVRPGIKTVHTLFTLRADPTSLTQRERNKTTKFTEIVYRVCHF